MTAIHTPIHSTAQAILDWWQAQNPPSHRPHLGASLIGHVCDRYLWLTFRNAYAKQHPGRILRLFDSGKREEPRVVAELRGIDCEVWAEEDGQQHRVSAIGGHFGGSMDGVVLGLPEAPKTPHVLEIKTHSAKSFADLVKRGVKGSKPQHFAQMQTYMHLAELERALYYAVNKDTDEVYIERVEYDRAFAQRLVERAQRIIEATEPPARIAAKAEDAPECGWCDFKEVCHGTQAAEVNCRTCCHATPRTDREGAKWECGLGGQTATITLHQQKKACDSHLYIPPLLSNVGEPVDGGYDYVVYRRADGSEFLNGPPPCFSSREIATGMAAPQMLTDPLVQDLKAQFPGAKLVSAAPWGGNALIDIPNDLDDAPAKPAVKRTRKKVAA